MPQRNYLISTTALSLTASGTTVGSGNTQSATFVVARTLVRSAITVGEFLSGSQTWSIHYVVSGMATPYEMRLKVQRLNSGGTMQAESGYGTTRSATGTYDDNLTADLGTWAEGDQLALVWEHRRPSGTGNKSGTIDANGASYIDAPSSSNVQVDLTGVSATGSAGTLGVSTDTALTGNEATTALGSVGVSHEQPLTGVSATGAVGSMSPSSNSELPGSRVFTKNLSNYMSLGSGSLGALINGAAKVSVHALTNFASFGTGATTHDRVLQILINTNGTGITIATDGSSRLRISARSVSTDGLQTRVGTTTIPTGEWVSIGGVVDYPADTITPYYEGSAQGGGSVTFANNSYTQGTTTDNDTIGGSLAPPTALVNQVDGKIAEVAVWNDDIGSAGFADLAAGISALNVRPDALVFYMRILGVDSPEPAQVSSVTGTITGSVPQGTYPGVTFLTALTGVSATGSAGNLAVDRTKALTGEQATSAVGSVGVDTSKVLTGEQATAGVGTLGVARETALSGVEATTATGSLSPSFAVPLNGVAGTSALNSLNVSTTVPITGVEGTGAVGSVTVESDSGITLELSGVQATGEVGSLSPSTDRAISGVQASGEAGTLGVSVTVALTGAEGTGQAGLLTPNTDKSISGNEATAQVGSVGVSLEVPLSGNQATGEVGTVVAESDTSITLQLSGVSATGQVGSLVPSSAVALSGVEGVSELGELGLSKGGSAALTGVQAEGQAGSLVPEISRLLSGNEAVSEVGSVSPAYSIPLSGVEATTGAGSLSVSVDVGLTGVQGVGHVGSFGLGGETFRTLNSQRYVKVTPTIVGQSRLRPGGTDLRKRDGR